MYHLFFSSLSTDGSGIHVESLPKPGGALTRLHSASAGMSYNEILVSTATRSRGGQHGLRGKFPGVVPFRVKKNWESIVDVELGIRLFEGFYLCRKHD
jgi:hypothetical protein